MKPNIFREYDIRGRSPDELGQETAFLLGRTFGTYFRDRGARSVSLGRDCRLSSPMLAHALQQGLTSTGTNVVDLGTVPTPLLYFSLHHLKVDGGVQDHLADVPVLVSTPEIRMDCGDEKKFSVVSGLVEAFKKEYPVIDVDGARVLFDGGWGLIRASNTQPVVVLRFEAVDEKRLHEIRDLFMNKLAGEMG